MKCDFYMKTCRRSRRRRRRRCVYTASNLKIFIENIEIAIATHSEG